MAYLGVPIVQDVSITFSHYSDIVCGRRFVLVRFSFVFRKVRGQTRKRWWVGERKKAFLSPPHPLSFSLTLTSVQVSRGWYPYLSKHKRKTLAPKSLLRRL